MSAVHSLFKVTSWGNQPADMVTLAAIGACQPRHLIGSYLAYPKPRLQYVAYGDEDADDARSVVLMLSGVVIMAAISYSLHLNRLFRCVMLVIGICHLLQVRMSDYVNMPNNFAVWEAHKITARNRKYTLRRLARHACVVIRTTAVPNFDSL